jgi:hypothetical protein
MPLQSASGARGCAGSSHTNGPVTEANEPLDSPFVRPLLRGSGETPTSRVSVMREGGNCREGMFVLESPKETARKHGRRDVRGSVGSAAAIDRRALGGTEEEYLLAIQEGLASTADLPELLGLNKSDALLREFVRMLQARLSARMA